MPSISDIQKKRRGRPATGITPQIGVRFPDATVEQIDKFAAEQEVDRSEAIRRLVDKALKNG